MNFLKSSHFSFKEKDKNARIYNKKQFEIMKVHCLQINMQKTNIQINNTLKNPLKIQFNIITLIVTVRTTMYLIRNTW